MLGVVDRLILEIWDDMPVSQRGRREAQSAFHNGGMLIRALFLLVKMRSELISSQH
jgi:hypothetical protein